MHCHNTTHTEPVEATQEITLYERPPEGAREAYAKLMAAAMMQGAPRPVEPIPRATWHGLCCDTCTERALAHLKIYGGTKTLLLVLKVR